MDSFLSLLAAAAPNAVILEREPLSRHTSFGIGGPARAVVCPSCTEDIPRLLSAAYRAGETLTVIGNGTNLLVSDDGLAGVVLKTAVAGNGASVSENILTASAGCLLSRAAVTAQKAGLGGFAFAHGIPGSVGGAVVMNAGAYGGEMAFVLQNVTYCDRKGEVFTKTVTRDDFGYRKSPFSGDASLTVLSAQCVLNPADPAEVRAEMDDLLVRRKTSQPLEYPSAGSVFKRPVGYFAGKLIQDAGLKGYRIGGAEVSQKHSGFIINVGGATCDDVRRLIAHIQETVLVRFGVELECEIRFLR